MSQVSVVSPASLSFKQRLIKFAMQLNLIEEYETFDRACTLLENAFQVDADMVICGGLHINRDVVIRGTVEGNIVVAKAGPSRVLVMPGAKVSDATISATSVEIHSKVTDVSIDTGDLVIGSGGAILGDSELRYSGSFAVHESVDINGRIVCARDSDLAHVAVTPSRQRIFK